MAEELKLVTVKSDNEKKPVKYFVKADSLTEADAILTKELQCEYKVNPYTPKVYEDIIRLYDRENNPDDEELLYYEVTFKNETIDDKIVKETFLLIAEDQESVLEYVKADEMEFSKLVELNVREILYAEPTEEEIDHILNKID